LRSADHGCLFEKLEFMLSIQTYTPVALAPYIKSFWCLKVSEDLDQPYAEEILPDGHHEIIFHVNAFPIRKRSDTEGWHHDPPVFFAGQNKKSYLQKIQPGAMMYAIRFQPHTQALLYNFPASLSTHHLIELSDVSANDILPGCIDESPTKTFANLEKELLKKFSRVEHPSNTFLYVDAAVRKILQHHGQVKMEQLEKITGVSERHLEKSFQHFVGLSPKHFCNIVRYGHVVTYKKNHPEKTLTECAHAAGFHDQSHLIYLSRLITGQSPKAYFNKLNHINNFFLQD
jgi:AraC-like DNA-binding protein